MDTIPFSIIKNWCASIYNTLRKFEKVLIVKNIMSFMVEAIWGGNGADGWGKSVRDC